MAVTGTKAALLVLSAFAVILLQGFFRADGGLDAMMRHAREGKFSNGKTLHHVYSGLPIVDELLSLSVSFWDPVCHQSRAVFLLSSTLSASLQSLGVFALIESLRKGDKNIILRYSSVNVFAWQYIGAAIFVPLYFVFELESHSDPHKASNPAVQYYQARSILPAALLTIVHLYRMVYLPPSGTTTAQHQAWLAIWQLAPFFCYCALSAFAASAVSGNRNHVNHAPNADVRWIKATYAAFGIFSGLTHLVVIWILSFSKDPSVSHFAAFIPRVSHLWQPDSAASVYIEESAFFLQWDYIIIVLATGIYATAILGTMYGAEGKGFGFSVKTVSLIITSITSHVASPGVVYAFVLYLREDYLRTEFARSIKKRSVKH